MPKDNQNTDSNSSSAMPNIPSQSDMPPLPPDFQNYIPSQIINTTPNQPVVPSPSLTPPPPAPTTIASFPRKKFGGGRVIATILGIFLLVGAVGAGVILTGQKQIFEQKASLGLGQWACANGDPGTIPPICCNLQGSGVSTCAALATSCSLQGRSWCKTSPNYPAYQFTCCVSGYVCGPNETGCVPTATPAPPTTNCPSGWITEHVDNECRKNGNCVGYNSCGSNPYDGCFINQVAGDSCNANQTECTYDRCGSPSSPTPAPTKSPTPSPTKTPTPSPTKSPTSKPSPGPASPTPSPRPPQCLNVKAYRVTQATGAEVWTLLTAAQLSALKTGATINFCVAGSTTTGTFDRAQFKINAKLKPETKSKRPNSNDYCQSYKILSTDKTVSVKAKIHHATLGWFGENI